MVRLFSRLSASRAPARNTCYVTQRLEIVLRLYFSGSRLRHRSRNAQTGTLVLLGNVKVNNRKIDNVEIFATRFRGECASQRLQVVSEVSENCIKCKGGRTHVEIVET